MPVAVVEAPSTLPVATEPDINGTPLERARTQVRRDMYRWRDSPEGCAPFGQYPNSVREAALAAGVAVDIPQVWPYSSLNFDVACLRGVQGTDVEVHYQTKHGQERTIAGTLDMSFDGVHVVRQGLKFPRNIPLGRVISIRQTS